MTGKRKGRRKTSNAKKKNFKCPKCSTKFPTKDKLLEHMMKIVKWPYLGHRVTAVPPDDVPCHTPSFFEKIEYFCDKCGVEYKCVSDFMDHKRNTGTCDVKKCLECNKNFARGKQCKHHGLFHSNAKRNPWKPDRSSRREETKKTTSRTKEYDKYYCSLCNVPGFGTWEGLRLHVVWTHISLPKPDIQPFKCPKCPETFDTKSELSEHMMKIVGQRTTYLRHRVENIPEDAPCYTRWWWNQKMTYVCDQCGVGFGNVLGFIHHKRTDGTCVVEKCLKCNKNFERGMQYECDEGSHEMTNALWKLCYGGDDDDSDDEGKDYNPVQMRTTELHKGPPTSPIPSTSNKILIYPNYTVSKETRSKDNVIHVQPVVVVETLRGKKVKAVPQSIFQNKRVRALTKDPPPHVSNLEDDIGGADSEKEKDDSMLQAAGAVVEPNPPVHEPGTVSYAMNLCLPKTQVVDYEDDMEKHETARIRRGYRSRLVGKPYLFKDRTPTDTQAVRAMRWDIFLTNPTPWISLPQELKVDAEFLKLLTPAYSK